MKLVCEINERLLSILEIKEPTASMKEYPLVGVPAYHWTDVDGALRLWPRPIPECKIYRLEEQFYAV